MVTSNVSTPTDSRQPLTIFYDGNCPLCSKEISFYQKCSGADRIHCINASILSEESIPLGFNQKQLLSRFHIVLQDGRLVSGGSAFPVF